jgi:hypothetical protein
LLVKRDETGKADGALKALFTAWGDQSLRDEFSEAIFAGGVEVSFLQFAALRFGRNWDGQADFGYNTIGYSIGPPGFRFSFAKYTPSDLFLSMNGAFTRSRSLWINCLNELLCSMKIYSKRSYAINVRKSLNPSFVTS